MDSQTFSFGIKNSTAKGLISHAHYIFRRNIGQATFVGKNRKI
jgi:hypothetical protein